MSRWTDQFDSNEIHAALTQLNDWLSVDVPDIDADHQVERRRILKVLAKIREIIDRLDPEFYPDQVLNQLNQQLRQSAIWANLNAYASNPSIQQLREANDGLSSTTPILVQLASLVQSREDRNLVRLVENANDEFCSKVSAREQTFVAQLEQSHARLASLEKTIQKLTEAQSALKQSTDTLLGTWQTEHTTALTERAEAFSKAQIDRGTQFDAALRELRNRSDQEIKDVTAKHTEKLETAFADYHSEAERLTADMKSKHEAILEIHGLVGTDGVAGGYQKGAADEQTAANFWRVVSMSSLGIAALWILLKYCLGFDVSSTGAVNWAEVVTAASLTLVLLGAAGYAARQSKLHRGAEQQMRWFALEVKAIDPFLSSLPEPDRNKIKEQLSQKLFGQNRLTTERSEQSVDLSAFKSFGDTTSSILKAVGKS